MIFDKWFFYVNNLRMSLLPVRREINDDDDSGCHLLSFY